jgi:hypothetical protein
MHPQSVHYFCRTIIVYHYCICVLVVIILFWLCLVFFIVLLFVVLYFSYSIQGPPTSVHHYCLTIIVYHYCICVLVVIILFWLCLVGIYCLIVCYVVFQLFHSKSIHICPSLVSHNYWLSLLYLCLGCYHLILVVFGWNLICIGVLFLPLLSIIPSIVVIYSFHCCLVGILFVLLSYSFQCCQLFLPLLSFIPSIVVWLGSYLYCCLIVRVSLQFHFIHPQF